MGNNLWKDIRTDPALNPFHHQYNIDRIYQAILSIPNDSKEPQEILELFGTLLSTPFFQSKYKLYYDYFKYNISQSHLSAIEIMCFYFAITNRDYLLLRDDFREKLNKNKEWHFEDSFKIKVNSSDPSFGRFEYQDGVEIGIDILNTSLNYLRYFFEISPSVEKIEIGTKTIDQLAAFYKAANILYVLKSSYEDALWLDGYLEINNETKTIFIKFRNPDQLILHRIGDFRLNRNSSASWMTVKEKLDNNKNYENFIKKHYYTRKHLKRIKTVINQDGYLKYKISDGFDKEDLQTEMRLCASIITYYPFLGFPYVGNVSLPNFTDLDLTKIISLFSTLSTLINKASEVEIEDTSVMQTSDLNKFIYKISVDDLKNYFKVRTKFSSRQIAEFITLLVHKTGRFNLWEKPLILEDNYYLIPYINIISPNIFFLIDTWIEEGGFSLDKRGQMLEDFIKKELTDDLVKKNYYFNIPKINHFRLPTGEYEEIDLILNLKHIIVFAEIKCVKFPMEARDKYNAIQRLKKGAEQINRKTKFIIDNYSYFSNDIGPIDGKSIVKLVITNYPLFTGLRLCDVPVVDMALLESYTSKGAVGNIKVTTYYGRVVDSEEIQQAIFYTNEDEFSKNFRENMENPLTVTSQLNLFEIKNQRINPIHDEYSVFFQCAVSIDT